VVVEVAPNVVDLQDVEHLNSIKLICGRFNMRINHKNIRLSQ